MSKSTFTRNHVLPTPRESLRLRGRSPSGCLDGNQTQSQRPSQGTPLTDRRNQEEIRCGDSESLLGRAITGRSVTDPLPGTRLSSACEHARNSIPP